MIVGVSHVTLLPLRIMGFYDIMIVVNVQPHVRCLVIFILTGQRPSTYLGTWDEEARMSHRPCSVKTTAFSVIKCRRR